MISVCVKSGINKVCRDHSQGVLLMRTDQPIRGGRLLGKLLVTSPPTPPNKLTGCDVSHRSMSKRGTTPWWLHVALPRRVKQLVLDIGPL